MSTPQLTPRRVLLQGDAAVTRELEGYEVERFRQMGRHLDLMWNVGKVHLTSAVAVDAFQLVSSLLRFARSLRQVASSELHVRTYFLLC